MKGTYLGEFEEIVLLTVCILHPDAYGVAIAEDLERITGRPASISAVHAALHRLEEKGFVKSKLGGATNERGGRRKRLFIISKSGQRALEEAKELRSELWRLVPNVLFNGK